MAEGKDILTRPQIDEALRDLPDWRYQLGGLVTVFKTPTAAAALKLIADVGRLAEEQDHHPDLDWRYNRVFLRYTSHDAGSEVTPRDVKAATAAGISASAAGAVAEPGLYRSVEIGIDTAEPEEISETWRVGLGYRKTPEGDLKDPHGRGPNVWFQTTPTPNPNRLHLDIHRSFAESGPAEEKTAATGADMNSDHAPESVVITDSQGNRFCLCTEAGTGPEIGTQPAAGPEGT